MGHRQSLQPATQLGYVAQVCPQCGADTLNDDHFISPDDNNLVCIRYMTIEGEKRRLTEAEKAESRRQLLGMGWTTVEKRVMK